MWWRSKFHKNQIPDTLKQLPGVIIFHEYVTDLSWSHFIVKSLSISVRTTKKNPNSLLMMSRGHQETFCECVHTVRCHISLWIITKSGCFDWCLSSFLSLLITEWMISVMTFLIHLFWKMFDKQYVSLTVDKSKLIAKILWQTASVIEILKIVD